MKTRTVTTLLLLGLLVPASTALACPQELAEAAIACAASFVGPDGEYETYHVGPVYVGPQDTVNTHPVCLN